MPRCKLLKDHSQLRQSSEWLLEGVIALFALRLLLL